MNAPQEIRGGIAIGAMVLTVVFLQGCNDSELPHGSQSGEANEEVRAVPPAEPETGPRQVGPPEGSVIVSPQQDLEDLVTSSDPGTTFYLMSGRYRLVTLRPKEGMTFIGENGAILTGEDVVEYAFLPTADNVTIRNLVVEHYASPVQMGAIRAGGHKPPDQTTGWVIEDCEIRYNHGGGIRTGDDMLAIGNYVHHNGQIGFVGIANNSLIADNEIAYNNTRGVSAGFEAGGTKFVLSDGLVIRGNYVHHNDGKGLWTDIDNINVIVENNLVEHNAQAGIMHEISYRAIIRNNIVRFNAIGDPVRWLWDGGIVIANSPDVEVYGNTVEDNRGGIAAIQQDRGSGRHGAWNTTNLYVHDNQVKLLEGRTGLAQDIGDTTYFTLKNNRFERNDYRLDRTARIFEWANKQITEDEWRRYGNDVDGTFVQLGS